ncbi:hypothetical protein GQ457_12G032540 [Hibiscus cannabinus]
MENKEASDQLVFFLEHLLSPKDPSSSSSNKRNSREYFPGTSQGRERLQPLRNWRSYHIWKGQSSGSTTNKDRNTSFYHNETVEPSYLSSSIYYGGQENYSPRNKPTAAPQYFKKEGEDDDPNGNNSSGASRGNWWQGSLYY